MTHFVFVLSIIFLFSWSKAKHIIQNPFFSRPIITKKALQESGPVATCSIQYADQHDHFFIVKQKKKFKKKKIEALQL